MEEDVEALEQFDSLECDRWSVAVLPHPSAAVLRPHPPAAPQPPVAALCPHPPAAVLTTSKHHIHFHRWLTQSSKR